MSYHYPIWREIGWTEDGDTTYGEIEVCGTCVPKHSHFPSRDDVLEWPCTLATGLSERS